MSRPYSLSIFIRATLLLGLVGAGCGPVGDPLVVDSGAQADTGGPNGSGGTSGGSGGRDGGGNGSGGRRGDNDAGNGGGSGGRNGGGSGGRNGGNDAGNGGGSGGRNGGNDGGFGRPDVNRGDGGGITVCEPMAPCQFGRLPATCTATCPNGDTRICVCTNNDVLRCQACGRTPGGRDGGGNGS